MLNRDQCRRISSMAANIGSYFPVDQFLLASISGYVVGTGCVTTCLLSRSRSIIRQEMYSAFAV